MEHRGILLNISHVCGTSQNFAENMWTVFCTQIVSPGLMVSISTQRSLGSSLRISYQSVSYQEGHLYLIYSSHGAAAELLLRHGAPAALQDWKGLTALHLAAWHGHVPVAEALLSRNAGGRSLEKEFLRPAHLGGDILVKCRPGNAFNKRPWKKILQLGKGADV